MRFSQRMRATIKALAIVLSVAMPVALIASAADARIGGGSSSGSRGSRTFSAPPSTSTAPNAARRSSAARHSLPARASARRRRPVLPAAAASFNRPGLLGGLAAGFLGAGLFGMLFGGGLSGGLGGLSSMIGLILQIGLIVIVARLAWSWVAAAQTRRPTPMPVARRTTRRAPQPQQPDQIKGFGFGLGSNAPPLKIGPDDYEAFEKLLWATSRPPGRSRTSHALRRLATDEMGVLLQ